ncbi:MAG: hypothetical protein CMM50_01410 [Rhodospirillaceae bacterium]|nr:hypothetical protein [Rhodospirillaceae bacterium]
MIGSAFRRLAAFICLLVLIGPAGATGTADSPPTGEAFALALRDHVVRIRAIWESGETQDGFGFVVGRNEGGVYIVTADHIVRGNLPGQVASEVSVTWFRRRGEQFAATLLGTHDAQRDVAVLRTQLPEGLSLRPELLVRTPALPERSRPVWYVGRAGQWYVPSQAGTVNSVDLDQQIMVDGLNVQVGTSGAPLVAENGIAGMIVADTIGGIPRAIGIDFIQRAFAFWAHPWDLHAATETVTAEGPPATPDDRGDAGEPAETAAPARESSRVPPPPERDERQEEEPETRLPAGSILDTNRMRQSIERRLAAFAPIEPGSAPDAFSAEAAPELALSNIDVRAGDAVVRASAFVTLDGTDLGRVTARVTAGPEPGKTAVTLSFPGGAISGSDGACRFHLTMKRADLIWDDDLGSFSGANIQAAPVSIECAPDFRLKAGTLTIESAFDRNTDTTGWSGAFDITFDRLVVLECDSYDCMSPREVMRAGAAGFRVAFKQIDFDGRGSVLADLPATYWPREAAFAAPAFDLIAAEFGALAPERVLAYLGDATISLHAEAAQAEIEQGINVRADEAALTFTSGDAARLTYHHKGATLSGLGAGVGVPPVMEIDVRTARRFDLAEISNGDVETWLDDIGPVAFSASAAGSRSAATGSGQLWTDSGAGAGMAHAVLESTDPASFLIETFLSPLIRQSGNPSAYRQALLEVIQLIASPSTGRAGRSYRFEIDADFMNQQATINGVTLSEIGWLFDDACMRYGC